MAKLTLKRILTSWLSPNKINDNSGLIEAAIEDTLSRSGVSPNTMGVDLDMGLNKITNLGAPSNPTDAVRLQDIEGLTGGGTVGDITTEDITNFNEAVEDLVGSKVQAGSNVTVTYDDATGVTTISATGELAGTVDWTEVTGKPSTFTPSTHSHAISDITGLQGELDGIDTALDTKAALSHTHSTGDITGLQEYTEDLIGSSLVAGSNITVSYNDSTGKTTINSTAEGGGSGPGYRLLSEFATIDGDGVNTSENDDAFTAAEAASDSLIYIPDGTYATTIDPLTLNKRYTGTGKIKYGSNIYPAKLANLNELPSPASGLQITGWFDGDQVFSDGGEHYTIGEDVRKYDLNATYFQSSTIPHHAWMTINSGNSGWQGRLASTASAGATSVTLTGAGDTDWIGKQFVFTQGQDGTPLSTHTVTNVSGTTVTFTPATPSTYSANLYGIKFAPRTWNGHTYIKVDHNGGGDGYGHIVRMKVGYVPSASEDHVFFTATGGQYGGDLNFVSSGVYGTGWESQYNDNGNDVAVIAQVDSFNRTNDTGGRGAYWLGSLFQSNGTKPADAAHVIAGKWRVGLDTVRADFTQFGNSVDNANIAINTKLGHRWVMNSTLNQNGRGGHPVLGTSLWGNTKGDMYIESGNDGISDYIALRFDRASGQDARLRIRPTAVQINTSLTVATTIGAGTDIFLSSTGILAFGAGTGNYLQMLGGHLYFHHSSGTWYQLYTP